ncbi:hypothetical protein V6N12_023547 [Hibiscus sabdariffa]|uniref:Uncharacterized protein n=1 Tax=Hibiscus sabdariffa TaxID=183260 RepID=A0ABR2FYX2_9ROSI
MMSFTEQQGFHHSEKHGIIYTAYNHKHDQPSSLTVTSMYQAWDIILPGMVSTSSSFLPSHNTSEINLFAVALGKRTVSKLLVVGLQNTRPEGSNVDMQTGVLGSKLRIRDYGKPSLEDTFGFRRDLTGKHKRICVKRSRLDSTISAELLSAIFNVFSQSLVGESERLREKMKRGETELSYM